MPHRFGFDPNSVLPLSHVAYHVLLSLATGDRHGYGIIKDVEGRTGGTVRLEAGTLYAAIKRIREEQWIEPVPSGPGVDARRRTYALTAHGRDVLTAECRRLEAMVRMAREAKVLPQRWEGQPQGLGG